MSHLWAEGGEGGGRSPWPTSPWPELLGPPAGKVRTWISSRWSYSKAKEVGDSVFRYWWAGLTTWDTSRSPGGEEFSTPCSWPSFLFLLRQFSFSPMWSLGGFLLEAEEGWKWEVNPACLGGAGTLGQEGHSPCMQALLSVPSSVGFPGNPSHPLSWILSQGSCMATLGPERSTPPNTSAPGGAWGLLPPPGPASRCPTRDPALWCFLPCSIPKTAHREFPGGPVVKTTYIHYQACRFKPWSGN